MQKDEAKTTTNNSSTKGKVSIQLLTPCAHTHTHTCAPTHKESSAVLTLAWSLMGAPSSRSLSAMASLFSLTANINGVTPVSCQDKHVFVSSFSIPLRCEEDISFVKREPCECTYRRKEGHKRTVLNPAGHERRPAQSN